MFFDNDDQLICWFDLRICAAVTLGLFLFNPAGILGVIAKRKS